MIPVSLRLVLLAALVPCPPKKVLPPTPGGTEIVRRTQTTKELFPAVTGLAGFASAQQQSYAGLSITAVIFEPEIQPIPLPELEALLPFRAGDLLDPLRVREAIERMFATGRYREILVDAQRSQSGVALRFLTKGTWFIGRVTAEGVSEPPNSGQLVNSAKLRLGEEFHNEDLQRAIDNLRGRLEANGFFSPQIDPVLDYDAATEQIFVDFSIDPGARARFTQPDVKGISPLDVSRFIDRTRWKRFGGFLGWKPVTETRVQNGLDRARRSFSKRDYVLSKVRLNSLDHIPSTNTVRADIDVTLGPKVEVRATGARLSRGRLRQLVPVFQEQAADRDLLVEGLRNITSYLQAQGYFRAKVDFDTEDRPGSNRLVLYRIDPGNRYKLARLDITGNRYFLSSTIRERLNIQAATRLRYRRGRFDEDLLRGDVDLIRDLYLSNGFRDAKVESHTLENIGGKPKHLGVHIAIQEGEQWRVETLELSGVSPERRAVVGTLIGSSEGQPYSEFSIATDRDNVLSYYFNEGFPSASFEWSVEPSATPHHVRVRMSIEEGKQQFVRGLLVSGLRTSNPDMVFQRIRLSKGDPLSQARMVESQRRLYDLGVFARVEPAVQNPDGNEPAKYVVYQFEEAKKYSVNFGFGAEIARIGGGAPNFDAPAGEPGFSPRASFGVSRTNFFGVGHSIGLQARASNIQQRAVATYIAPHFKGRENVTLSISGLYDLSKDIRTFAGRRQEGSVQLSQRLTRANTLQARFTYRHNSVTSLAIDRDLIPIYSRPVRVGILSATLYQDHRDDPVDSRRGWYNSFDFGVASKAFASQSDYLRFLSRNSTYHKVAKDVIFARSLLFGLISNTAAGGPEAIPLPERFFSGGAANHRGFSDNQAGPRDLSTGFPLGGGAVLMNNLELRFPLYGDNLGGVLFHDAGNVYRSVTGISFRAMQPSLSDFTYMVHAIGFGFRYKTPVGPVRIDLAYGPNSPRFQFEKRSGLAPGAPRTLTGDRISRFQFHFSLGQTF